jgi:catechol 2,3-dioxygenase-like lactoylglutathione lyase family enzyme
MPISLHHAQVFYPPGAEAKARAFYGTALGLAELERPASLSDREGIWYAAGDGQVHLSAQTDLALHKRRHFALRVDDLDAIRMQLTSHGARFEEADPIPGWRRCYVFDPFGNKIELDEIPVRP